MKDKFPDVTGESHFLVLPFDVSDFKSHATLMQTVLQYFQKVRRITCRHINFISSQNTLMKVDRHILVGGVTTPLHISYVVIYATPKGMVVEPF